MQHRYIKTDDPNLVRDITSGAIINMDDSYYKQILASRQHAKQTQDVCNRMSEIESELSEIKSLLQQIVNGRTNG